MYYIVMKLIAALFIILFCGIELQAQVVGAVPDKTRLQQPFGKADKATFSQPDKIFYPETWFHFINGSIKKSGISTDLQAIADAGITGISFFHGQQGDPADWPGTEEHIECLSSQWEELLHHTAKEAKRMGLRFSIQTCPGWAMSGGPWVEPSQSMRHLVYSRTDVEGGKLVGFTLKSPQTQEWQDYKDLMVLAFPTPLGDTGAPLQVAKVMASTEQKKWHDCLNGKLEGAINLLPTTDKKPYVIDVELADVQTVRSLVFNPIDLFNHAFCVDPGIHVRMTAIQADGSAKVVLDSSFPMSNWEDSQYTMTFALDESPARHYRIEIVNQHPMNVSSMRLYSAARKSNWEGEGGWTLRRIVRENENPRQSSEAYVHFNAILDLTHSFAFTDSLTWQFPTGKWTVLRIGHVNSGQRNSPAPAEATGWEINKFDPQLVDFQFNSYVGRLKEGPLNGLLDNMLMDSWECRSQTWTEAMPEAFLKQVGYELKKWIPALFGYVIDSPEVSSEFLNDFRQTQNRLFVDNFYGRMAQNAHNNGMTIQFETAAGDIFPGCPMEYYKWADVPMAEFWQPFSHHLANRNFKPIRPTASAARMYGKPRVSAEAFTSFDLNWDEHLSMLREVANQNMLDGITHLVFHTYTHNPDPDKYQPGTSFGGAIGTPFLRKQTWWPYMHGFTTYLARNTFLLERGKPVSDVLWFLGDEIQQKPNQKTDFPQGYKYDYCNTDALMNRLDVKEGQWVTPEGISYKVLWIPTDEIRLLPATVKRLAELVRKGGVLVADAPQNPATRLQGVERESFVSLVEDLWHGDSGKGRLLSGLSIEQALKQLHLLPDVKPTSAGWLHRKVDGADWYMVCAPQESSFSGNIAFHITGRAELWNPMNGSVEPLAVQESDGYSQIKLSLEQGECKYVVFWHDGIKEDVQEYQMHTIPLNQQKWTLNFPKGWGIQEPLYIQELQAWNELPLSEEGKAFSGTVSYETTLLMNQKDPEAHYFINLGKVEEIAVVKLNGSPVDTLWAAPYRTEITSYVTAGRNRLTVEVTSTWHNRLAFDAALPEKKRKTWVIAGLAAGSKLKRYGLLGPVMLEERKIADGPIKKTLPVEIVEADGIQFQKTHQKAFTYYNVAKNITFFDFGKDAFSQLYLNLSNTRNGDTIYVHLGECMQGNRVDRNPGGARRYKKLSIITEQGKTRYEVPLPHDGLNTRHPAVLMPERIGEVTPFRYCEVELPYDQLLNPDNVIRIAVNVPFNDEASYFHCDNENLNRIWELCKYSIKATTFSGYYVDGDRERISYEADALINQLGHYAVDAEYDVARRTFERLMKLPTWPSEWILSMDLVAWYDYLYTGNTDLIRRYQKALRAHTLLDLVDPKTGLVSTTRGQSQEFLASICRTDTIRDIVDWPHSGTLGLAPGQGGEDDGYVYTTHNTVVNAYHYAAVNSYARMLAAIGNQKESKKLLTYCKKFQKTFNKYFLNKEKGYYLDGTGTDHASLHANIFAVVFGLVPQEYKESVADFILSRGMACSVYGSQFLLDALYDCHRGEDALRLMTSDAKRSWMNMLHEGSTITMEAWSNEYKPNQDWNHAWGAAPANIIPMRLMGVRPLVPGCAEIEIFPQIGSLHEAECLVPTPRGGVRVKVVKEKDSYTITTDIPTTVQALFRIPNSSGDIITYPEKLSGKRTFSIPMK